MRLIRDASIKEMPKQDSRPIYVTIEISDGTIWTNLECLIDTGCLALGLVIPQALIEALDLNLRVIDRQESVLADNTPTQENITLASVRLKSIPGNRHFILENVKVAVIKDGIPLIGMDVLSLMDLVIKNGKLVFLDLSN